MSEDEKRIIVLKRSDDLSPRVAFLFSMMDKVRSRLLKQIDDLSIEELDFTPDDKNVETIGTLIQHIAAVEWSWIFEDIDGVEMNYERWKHAFALREEIPQQKDMKLKYYLDKLEGVRDDVLKRLAEFNDSELHHLVDIGAAVVSIEWILFHIIEHEAMHIGQISLLKRLQKK